MPSLRTIAWSAFILAGGASVVIAAPAVTPQQVRAAVERSLPAIEKVGTAWIKERKCNSCHVVAFLVWSHNEAAAHGLKVDRKKLDEWTQWALADSLADKRRFRLRPHAMDVLKSGELGELIFAKVQPLAGKGFLTLKEFTDALEKALGPEDFARHKDELIRLGTLPNDGGGPDTLSQLLLGRASAPADKANDGSFAAIRDLLLEWQEPNGAWAAAGQLPSLKWSGVKEMNDATTLWSVLALNTGKSKSELDVRSQERALEVLKESRPGTTLQSLALHLIAAHQFSEPANAEKLHRDLLQRQNADGGWSWVSTNKVSDAFATGQALYALGLYGRDGNDPAVQSAWQFLVQTQGKDGGWEVPQNLVNLKERKLNVYPFWGTAWAAIGLLQTVPATNDTQ